MRLAFGMFVSIIISWAGGTWAQAQDFSLSPTHLTAQDKATAAQSSITAYKLANIVFVDGVKYRTVQAAIDSLPPTGGSVYVPPGTYAGPTVIPSNVRIEGYLGIVPAATLNANPGNSLALYPAFSADQQTVFTYTSNLTLLNATNIWIRNIAFDFQNTSSGIVLNSSAFNRFDITVRNTKGTALLLTTSPPGVHAGSTVNIFDRFMAFNVGKGISLTADSGGASASANNYFGYVLIDGVRAVGIETIQFCDSNNFSRVHIAGLADTASGVIINDSEKPDSDTDAGGQLFEQLLIDPGNPNTYSGTLLAINNSQGTYIGQFGAGAFGGHGVVLKVHPNATYTAGWSEDFSGSIPMGTLETSFLNVSGRPGGANGLTLSDTRVPKWSLFRGASEEFNLADLASSDPTKQRVQIISGAASHFGAKGSSAVQFNMLANSGTGGAIFGSGGPSPSPVASIDGAGRYTLGATTVDALPPPSAHPGMLVSVSDSTAVTSEGQKCVAGGSSNALAFSDGLIWKCF